MNVAWEWLSYTKYRQPKWNRYTEHISKMLEKKYQRTTRNSYIHFNGFHYIISFQNMTQTNIHTGKIRKIRRTFKKLHTSNHKNLVSYTPSSFTKSYTPSFTKSYILLPLINLNTRTVDSYIKSYINQPQFKSLHSIMHSWDNKDLNIFVYKLCPFIFHMCSEVKHYFPNQKLEYMLKDQSHIVTLTQKQCCCLLSLAFFDLFPNHLTSLDMNGKFTFKIWLSTETEKLKCLLTYFFTMHKRFLTNKNQWASRNIQFVRKVTKNINLHDMLIQSHKPLLPVNIKFDGKIEESNKTLQSDFANAHIGGGVLRHGSVQEEIRFTISPECLISVLICEKMNDNESIVIIGAERFCNYSGYSRTFKFTGIHHETVHEQNSYNVLNIRLVLFDAVDVHRNTHIQYTNKLLQRDMLKLYTALSPHKIIDHNRASIFSTGNWGCGVFGGDKKWKFIEQWLVSSFTNKQMIFFTSKNSENMLIQKWMAIFLQKKMTVSQLYKSLLYYKHSNNNDIFKHILNFSKSNSINFSSTRL